MERRLTESPPLYASRIVSEFSVGWESDSSIGHGICVLCMSSASLFLNTHSCRLLVARLNGTEVLVYLNGQLDQFVF